MDLPGIRSKEEQARLIEICKPCINRRADFKLFGFTIFKRTPQCRLCKCSITKAVMFSWKPCPINEWK